MFQFKTGGAVNGVDELLVHNDESFIEIAYRTILGRFPDAHGRAYYLRRLRAGVSKLAIMADLRLSTEGKGREVELHGLDKVVKNYRRASTPLIGRLLASPGGKATDESNRALRAIENQLFVSTNLTREYLERMDAVLQAVVERQHASTPAPVAVVSAAPAAADAPAHALGLSAPDSPVAIAQLYYCAEENRTYDLAYESRTHADYLAAIGASKLFNADFYLSTYSVGEAFRHQPELHYVVFGENRGWQPSAVFWPDNYLLFNADVAAAGARPFRHFIETGRFEARVSHPLAPLEGGLETPTPTPTPMPMPTPVAVVSASPAAADAPAHARGLSAPDSPLAVAQLYHCAEENRTYDLAQESRAHADYLAAIGASKLFNADFYLSTYSVEEAFRHQPELHYVLFGENRGWQPSAVFWPDNYLLFNTDVAAAGARPFWHFIETGRFESRVSRPLPPLEGGLATPMPTLRQRAFSSPNKVAVCLHVFYVDLWPELVESLRRLTVPFDLFVGLVDRGQPLDDAKASVTASFPDARVFVFPNHGRDIFPFVSMATAGLFDRYEAVCKIHTKKSPHRDDGAEWRNTLVNGILPKKGADKLLAAFLANPDWGLMVADGQIYDGQQWWGSNKELVPRLLHRVEIRPDLDYLHFPAGSIYWIKQPLLNLVRGMQLGADDFDPEGRQLDGTPAHAFERILGYLGVAAGVDIVDTSTVLKAVGTSRPARAMRKPFVSCFYLPQFHRVPENDAWWGEGYTEWVGASRARAQFDGQYHPVTPAGSGYYDLRNPEVIGEQFKLAKAHGVDAFCVYYYAFDNGKRLLEAPIDNLLKRPDIDACFYLCWANESWTRNWDGMSGEVLMPQTYLPNCVDLLAEDTSRYFADQRYFRLHGSEPRFVIYRPEDIPNLPEFLKALRAAWAAKGFPKVNLGAVLFHTVGESSEASAALFDFIVEMPPHGLVKPNGWIVNKDAPTHDPAFPVSKSFKGLVYSYDHVIEQSLKRELPAYLEGKIVRGVMPSWDNTARRGSAAHICYGGNPAAFGRWVKGLAAADTERSELMVNSWNEWAEKAMIEPACQYGNGYLDALKRAFAGMAPSALAAGRKSAIATGKPVAQAPTLFGKARGVGKKRRAR